MTTVLFTVEMDGHVGVAMVKNENMWRKVYNTMKLVSENLEKKGLKAYFN